MSTTSKFESIAGQMFNMRKTGGKTFYRRFKSSFGVSPLICSVLWHLVSSKKNNSLTWKHLLWTLFHLKVYNTENVMASMFHADEKTIKNRISSTLDAFNSLKLVSELNAFHYL